MNFSLLLTTAAALCLALSSGIPTSKNPLSPVETAHTDSALIGDWLNKKDQETYRITTKSGPWMHVDIFIDTGEKLDSYDFYVTSIGDNTFANVATASKDNPSPNKGYTFFRYSLPEKGILKMWSMSDGATFGAIKAGKLGGLIEHENRDPEIYLWDNSAGLTKFIQIADLDKLFTNEATLTKVESKDK